MRSIPEGRLCSWKTVLLACSVLLLGLTSTSCNVQSTSADGGPPAQPTAMMAFCDDAVSGCPSVTSFSLSAIRDLVIKVDWYDVSQGNHAQMLKVLLPEGGTYEMSQTGFLVSPGADNSFSSVRVIPLAGSWVTQRQEIGPWSVEVSLDGKVISTQSVEMTP